jgi:exopolyphosphatase/guanosine-5'-triphosphate,3'-diphosphate pyrophosphatase
MRCACIDIGSNTTRLLVAEPVGGSLREVMAQRAFTRLGAGRGHDDPVSPAKMAEVTTVVAAQAAMARAAGAESILVVATAAIRSAANREEVVAAIGEAAGLEVSVLSGDDEASLAFTGATAGLRHLTGPTAPVGVADVGGGSSELVCGTLAQGATWSASFRVGSGFLADAYLRSDPPAAAELTALRRHAEGVFEGLEVPGTEAAFAVGGSATSLRTLVGAELSHEALERGIDLLSTTPIAEVARRFGLHAERVRILPAGMLLLEQAVTAFGRPLQIAGGGLREGVILRELWRVGALEADH